MDDNIIQFPGAKTPEDLEFFNTRCTELRMRLEDNFIAFINEHAGAPCRLPLPAEKAFMLNKLASLQAGLELTMKTVIERTK